MAGILKILALPGFLGLPTDFDPFFYQFETHLGRSFEKDVLNVCTDEDRGPFGSWPDWSLWQAQEIRKWKGDQKLLGIGYSLGGRLLFSIAQADPTLFDQLNFLSVNPGLKQASEKNLRLKNDEAWAERFESEDWESLMRDWNSQPVFKDSILESDRREKDFDRQQLAQVMREFSTGLQTDYRGEISNLKVPQLWVAGEKDQKFSSFLSELPESSHLAKLLIKGIGHRIHLEAPEILAEKLRPYGV